MEPSISVSVESRNWGLIYSLLCSDSPPTIQVCVEEANSAHSAFRLVAVYNNKVLPFAVARSKDRIARDSVFAMERTVYQELVKHQASISEDSNIDFIGKLVPAGLLLSAHSHGRLFVYSQDQPSLRSLLGDRFGFFKYSRDVKGLQFSTPVYFADGEDGFVGSARRFGESALEACYRTIVTDHGRDIGVPELKGCITLSVTENLYIVCLDEHSMVSCTIDSTLASNGEAMKFWESAAAIRQAFAFQLPKKTIPSLKLQHRASNLNSRKPKHIKKPAQTDKKPISRIVRKPISNSNSSALDSNTRNHVVPSTSKNSSLGTKRQAASYRSRVAGPGSHDVRKPNATSTNTATRQTSGARRGPQRPTRGKLVPKSKSFVDPYWHEPVHSLPEFNETAAPFSLFLNPGQDPVLDDDEDDDIKLLVDQLFSL